MNLTTRSARAEAQAMTCKNEFNLADPELGSRIVADGSAHLKVSEATTTKTTGLSAQKVQPKVMCHPTL